MPAVAEQETTNNEAWNMNHLHKRIVGTSVRYPNSVGMVPLYPLEARETRVVLVGSVMGRVSPLVPPGMHATIAAAAVAAARGSTFLARV